MRTTHRSAPRGAWRPWTLALIAGLAVVSLSSCDLFRRTLGVPDDCDRFQRDVAFADSELILRGTWTGSLPDWPRVGDATQVTLTLAATYEDTSYYRIDGTLQLGAEPPYQVAGTVHGGCAQRYVGESTADLAPVSLPPGLSIGADASQDGTVAWNLTGGRGALAEDEEGRVTLHLRMHRADGGSGETFWREVEFMRVQGD